MMFKFYNSFYVVAPFITFELPYLLNQLHVLVFVHVFKSQIWDYFSTGGTQIKLNLTSGLIWIKTV